MRACLAGVVFWSVACSTAKHAANTVDAPGGELVGKLHRALQLRIRAHLDHRGVGDRREPRVRGLHRGDGGRDVVLEPQAS